MIKSAGVIAVEPSAAHCRRRVHGALYCYGGTPGRCCCLSSLTSYSPCGLAEVSAVATVGKGVAAPAHQLRYVFACRVPDIVNERSLPIGTTNQWYGSSLKQWRTSQMLANGDQFMLQRAPGMMALEAKLDASSTATACRNGRAQLAGLPATCCKPLHCLWSSVRQVRVDMWLHALTAMPEGTSLSRCPEPVGGQAPASDEHSEAGGIPLQMIDCSLTVLPSIHEALTSTRVSPSRWRSC